MAKIYGDGIKKTGTYEARPAMMAGLYYLSELPAAAEEPDSAWNVKIEATLGRRVRQKFGGTGKNFREAVDLALRHALLNPLP